MADDNRVYLTIPMDQSIMDRLEAACERDRLKPAKSKLARVIIEEWLDEEEEKVRDNK